MKVHIPAPKDSDTPGLDEYHDVWVLAEQREGRIRGVTLELLGKGRELADSLDSQLVAVLLGNNVGDQCRQLISFGADKVIWIDDPELEHYQTGIYTDVVTKQILQHKPEILLIGQLISVGTWHPGSPGGWEQD